MIDLDAGHGGDWLKKGGLDWPLSTEAGFKEWMKSNGITPEHLRRMPLYSKANVLLYPWLERLANAD